MSYDLQEYKRLPRFLQGMTLYSAARESVLTQRATSAFAAYGEGEIAGFNRGWTEAAPINERTGYHNGFMDATKTILTGDNYIAFDKKDITKLYSAPTRDGLMNKLSSIDTDLLANPYYGIINKRGDAKKIPVLKHNDAVYLDITMLRENVKRAKETQANAEHSKQTPVARQKAQGKIRNKVIVDANDNSQKAQTRYTDPAELIDDLYKPTPLGTYHEPVDKIKPRGLPPASPVRSTPKKKSRRNKNSRK